MVNYLKVLTAGADIIELAEMCANYIYEFVPTAIKNIIFRLLRFSQFNNFSWPYQYI